MEPNLEKEVSITLKVNDWNIIMNALASRPYGEVSGLIPEIQRQANSQINDVSATANEVSQSEMR